MEKQVPSSLEAANTQRRYYITAEELPLCCPLPRMELWNSHPRVYLPIAVTGKEQCPYCGAEFILTDDLTSIEN